MFEPQTYAILMLVGFLGSASIAKYLERGRIF